MLAVILNDIRSVHNVGAIFRTADAVGVDKLYLTGYTPAPKDRFGRDRSDLSKTALGAEKTVKWEQGDIQKILSDLKLEGYTIICVEQDKSSVDYRKLSEIEGDKVLVLGNEVSGISKDILSQSDYIIELPMKGKKESLNVSVTAGIVLYEAVRDLK